MDQLPWTRKGRLALRAVADGPLDDDATLRAAWRAHATELAAYASRSLGDRQAGEEAVQETFVRAWRAAGRYDTERGSLRTWLLSICRRVVIDGVRARAARPPLALAEPREEASGADELERALLRRQLEEALGSARPATARCWSRSPCVGRR